ncbi:MAG: radical SAM protein [Deltaproteobacteria bacterium]|nr:radical SAM protein [Deltaproteobacteria bacterium]MBN2846223.1 radical SAM protein [Deltaproteobacteria bacterium]
MQEKKKTYTFGPVPSRRLGRSLGIDFVPFKTCSYDCIYCQLGRTTAKTMKRKEYCPVDAVVNEVKEKLKKVSPPDYITLSGSGEPTLHSRIGDIISGIKEISDVPVAVLTNGSLFWIEEVRDAVSGADLIIPSLDAGSEETFLRVNRPESGILFKEMVEGLRVLRENFMGPLWLEVFITGGITDYDEEIAKIKGLTDYIAPDRIQLNTAVRIPAEEYAGLVDIQRMEEISTFFGPSCEVIADYARVHSLGEFSSTGDDVLELLRLRPCSVDDISAGLSLHRNEVVKYVQELLDKKLIRMEKRRGEKLYTGR